MGTSQSSDNRYTEGDLKTEIQPSLQTPSTTTQHPSGEFSPQGLSQSHSYNAQSAINSSQNDVRPVDNRYSPSNDIDQFRAALNHINIVLRNNESKKKWKTADLNVERFLDHCSVSKFEALCLDKSQRQNASNKKTSGQVYNL